VSGVVRLVDLSVSYRLPPGMAGWTLTWQDGMERLRITRWAAPEAEYDLTRVEWLQMLLDYGALLHVQCPAGWAASWDKDFGVIQHDTGSMCGHEAKDAPAEIYASLARLAALPAVAVGDVMNTSVWTAAFVNRLREEAGLVLTALVEARMESKRGW
jgi:hypothetical protein